MPSQTPERGQPKLIKRPGRRNWYVQWTPRGSRRSKISSTGVQHHQADAPQSAALKELDDFVEDMNGAGPDPSLADLLDARLEEARGRVTAHDNMRLFHVQLKREIGHLKPGDWTPARNARYIRARPAAAGRRELQELRAAFLLHGRADPEFRAPGVSYPPPRPPRERFLDRRHKRRLLDAARPVLHVWLWTLIAITTGRRKGAILDLTWDRVDLERRVVDFDNPERQITKKRRGAVKIARDLAAALADARSLALSDHVIEYAGRPVADIKKGFRGAVARAGLPDWVTPHALKHSVVSWLAEDGYTVDRIADMTGTDAKTIDRIYRKVNPESLEDMADSLAEGLFPPESATAGRTLENPDIR